MVSSLNTLIRKPVANVFRRAYIKRRLSATGLFETDWLEITRYIRRWGSFTAAIDDVALNKFTHSGIRLTVVNDGGEFNPESNDNSLWFGYLTRYRTLVKIEAGYFDEDETELPADPTQGIYLLDGEIKISAKTNAAVLNCKSMVSVFDDIVATDISGLGATLTASEIITRVRDHTDGAGTAIFHQFITSTAWSIQTTTLNYNLATTTSLDGLTTWELMQKIAEAEGFQVHITRTGGFEFSDRLANTTTVSLSLYGQGFAGPNIIELGEYKEALDKYHNYFRFQWAEADTATSYVFAGTTTTVDPNNLSWKYGNKIYKFENTFFLTATTAQTVVDNLLTEFQSLKDELVVKAKFLPDTDIGDLLAVHFYSYGLADATIWDQFNWDEANWSDPGENFEWNGVEFKVLSRKTDLQNFTTTLRLRAD